MAEMMEYPCIDMYMVSLIPSSSAHHLCPGTAMPLSQSSCIHSHLVSPPGRVAFLNAHLIRVCFYLVSPWPPLLCEDESFTRLSLRLTRPWYLARSYCTPNPSRGFLQCSHADFDSVAPCSSKWHYSYDFASGPLYMISQNLTSFSCKPEQYTSMEKVILWDNNNIQSFPSPASSPHSWFL